MWDVTRSFFLIRLNRILMHSQSNIDLTIGPITYGRADHVSRTVGLHLNPTVLKPRWTNEERVALNSNKKDEFYGALGAIVERARFFYSIICGNLAHRRLLNANETN